jgi:hypothetical protein
VKKLVYASKRRCDDPAEIERMLATSRANNRADGLTGLLLYDDKRFLQLIEGDHDPIARCFLRIARSRLHAEIEIAVFEDSPVHLFANWDMRSIDLGGAAPSLASFWRRAQAAPEDRRREMVERFFLENHAAHR